MIYRCNNPRCGSYNDYGGRGIKVCERWLEYDNFLFDMGPRPEGMSIDRIDNNEGYNPKNCRWATKKEQSRNKSNNVMIDIGGDARPMVEWAELRGISYAIVKQRYRYGLRGEDLLVPNKHAERFVIFHGKRIGLHKLGRRYGIPYSVIKKRYYEQGHRGDKLVRPLGRTDREVRVKYLGECKNLFQWSQCLGIKHVTLKARYRAGKRGSALFAPTQKKFRKNSA